jgi:arylsulfatase
MLAMSPVCGGCGPTTPGELPGASGGDVLLITVDTLRADRLGLYGYSRPTTPEIDRWFANGAVFLRAYSTSASTSPSVASLLTGEWPQDHEVRLFYQLIPEKSLLVADRLPKAYQTAAFVSNMVLTDEAIGFASRFDHYDDFVDERESSREVYERNAERTTEAALLWLRTELEVDRPLFLWVHYNDPHGPYRPPVSWRGRFSHRGQRPIDLRRVRPYIREPGVVDGLAYVDRYDEEIAYLDHQVGRLLEGYARLRPIDEALLLLTADHGESMMEHEQWFTHGYHVYEEIIRVPLLLNGPGVPRGRVDALASGVDLAPTILHHAGVEVPSSLPGIDLRSPESLPPDRVVFAEATGFDGHSRAALQGSQKRMLSIEVGEQLETTAHRGFDLESDPGELTRSTWTRSDPLGRRLLQYLEEDPVPNGILPETRKGMKLTAPKVAPGVSKDAEDRLRALGYVE